MKFLVLLAILAMLAAYATAQYIVPAYGGYYGGYGKSKFLFWCN